MNAIEIEENQRFFSQKKSSEDFNQENARNIEKSEIFWKEFFVNNFSDDFSLEKKAKKERKINDQVVRIFLKFFEQINFFKKFVLYSLLA